MVDVSALASLFSVESGVWAIAVILALLVARIWNSVPALVGRWIEFRKLKAAERGADWRRLREERNHYHDLLRECEQERALLQHRAVTAEAALQGYGDVRQAAAAAAAEVRLDAADKARKDKPK